MFVLDTNVVSEFMQERPNPSVLHWLDNRLERDLFVTAVTQAEVLTGIAIMSARATARGPGRRSRSCLQQNVRKPRVAVRPVSGASLCKDHRGTTAGGQTDIAGRLPERRHCRRAGWDGSDKERPRFRGNRDWDCESVGEPVTDRATSAGRE